MAEREFSTREMVRSTLSHEVRGLLVNLGFQLGNFDSLYKSSEYPDTSAAAPEVERAKSEIRTHARKLSKAVNEAELKLRQKEVDPRTVFAETDLGTKARELLSRASLLKEKTGDMTKIADRAILVHRSALNIERMVKMSSSLFGGEFLAPESISSTTIIKDIESIVPANDVGRVAVERSSVPTFRGYRRELISAAANLVRNGLKYTRPDEPSRVVVELFVERLSVIIEKFPTAPTLLPRPYDATRPWVCLQVTDTGRGVPEQMRGTIFKPFVRLDDAGKAHVVKDEIESFEELFDDEQETHFVGDELGVSHGFGLTIVQRVAELHKGVAIAKSGLSVGMVFAIIFPFISPSSSAPKNV